MDTKNTKWHGTNVSLEKCISEYGFVMRYDEERREYQVLYDTGEDDWMFSWFDYDGFVADLKASEPDEFPDLYGLADMCGMTPDEYLDGLDEAGLCWDLLAYYGWSDIFGEGYYRIVFSEMEVRKMVGI